MEYSRFITTAFRRIKSRYEAVVDGDHMKITFICAVFPPEPAPAGVMAHQLATRLVKDGHDVTMVVPFPNRPEGVLYPGFQRSLYKRIITEEGYRLIRCAHWLLGKRRRTVDRLLENFTFGISSVWAAWRDGRPDVFIIETWPLIACALNVLLARLLFVPYLYYVQDVYPEAATDAGILSSSGVVARACRSWDRYLCLHSANVVVISETMQDLLAANRRLSSDRFSVVPNWIDESLFPVHSKDGSWRRSQGIPNDAFIALFAGTLGHVSGAEILIEVASLLRAVENVLLLCIGEGIQKEKILNDASRMELNNLRFLPFQPRERVPEIQASCDVALLTMRPNSSDASVPSKLISYLAASRPVICAANLKSAVARAVLDAKAGLVVQPGDARAIAGALLSLQKSPEQVRDMGKNAREYFLRNYTLDRSYSRFSRLIVQSAGGRI